LAYANELLPATDETIANAGSLSWKGTLDSTPNVDAQKGISFGRTFNIVPHGKSIGLPVDRNDVFGDIEVCFALMMRMGEQVTVMSGELQHMKQFSGFERGSRKIDHEALLGLPILIALLRMQGLTPIHQLNCNGLVVKSRFAFNGNNGGTALNGSVAWRLA
jgi:hypothetical protein